jgi:hypothetical protein
LSDRPILDDLDADEVDLHRLLAGAPQSPPIGFRDTVMASLRDRRVAWEWIIAALFAIPSGAFLARQVIVHGQDFAQAMANIMTAASSETSDAFFFVDGLTVIALALLGIACAFAAHALLISGSGSRTVAQ